LLRSQKEELDKEGVVRINQLEQIEKTTKLLVSRDRELSKINKELDKKIRELEYSKNSLTQALDDLNKNKKIIEEEKNKTASIIASFSDPILVLDKENRLSLFNEAAKKVLGLTNLDLNREISAKDEFSLENFKDIIKKRFDFKKLRKPDQEEISLLEELNLTATQEEDERTFKVITIRITDSKKEYGGTMKMFYDVTREKNIDKMKSDFISIAAHQLRTPLSAIKWSAETEATLFRKSSSKGFASIHIFSSALVSIRGIRSETGVTKVFA
jgi:signal transduction histidine kinase